jgi:hypothetical protein
MLVGFWKWLGEQPASSASFLGTLTGSGLGLIALLLGALFNAHLNRRRDDALRDADRVAVATALHAELQGIHHGLVKNIENLTDLSVDKGFLVPHPSIKILPEVLSKIGLLRSDIIHKVMEAYVLMEQYFGDLILVGGKVQSDMPDTRPMVYLEGKHAKFVAGLGTVRAGVVKEAMDALAPYLNA